MILIDEYVFFFSKLAKWIGTALISFCRVDSAVGRGGGGS